MVLSSSSSLSPAATATSALVSSLPKSVSSSTVPRNLPATMRAVGPSGPTIAPSSCIQTPSVGGSTSVDEVQSREMWIEGQTGESDVTS